MLDLNALADRRAKALNQAADAWRRAIWSSSFQKLTVNMTDGEVETFVAYCKDADHFAKVAKFLEQRCDQAKTSPFTVIQEEAVRAGTTPQLWLLQFATAEGA